VADRRSFVSGLGEAARGGFVDAIGQWPGDESDDEVNAGLRDVE